MNAMPRIANRQPGSTGRRRGPRITRWARLAAALAFASVAAPALALEPGAPAPAIELPGAAGPVKVDAYRGKLVYVDFWASWCKPCQESFPFMNDLQTRYGPRGLQIVGINVDAKTDDARAFLARTPAQFVIAFDDKGVAPKAYGIKGMPTSFLLGRDGRVLMQHTGFHDGDRAGLEAAIRQALEAK